jgi:hypothetical protein
MPAIETDRFPRQRSLQWDAGVAICCLFWLGLGLFFWQKASFEVSLPLLTGILLAGIFFINLLPLGVDIASRSFDPFEVKHIFLVYFFMMLSLHSFARVVFDTGTGFLEENPAPSPLLRIRALAAILCGLSAFVLGCYVPVGRIVGRLLPNFSQPVNWRLNLLAWGGVALGAYCFWALTAPAGGIAAFVGNLSTWRTVGVLAGVGHLTFPISTVMPSYALLLVLRYLHPAPARLTWRLMAMLLLYGATLIPVLLLGFRIGFLSACLQLLAAWHYRRKPFRMMSIIMVAVTALSLLSVYSSLRRLATGDTPYDNPLLQAVVFRVAGLDTVERVVWRLDQGEPHRGLLAAFTESVTIIGPRALWPGKPKPASLDFADIFFYDYFLARGDRVDDIRSGMSPTLIGECLWVGGLPFVIGAAFFLGVSNVVLSTWRRKSGRQILHIWVVTLCFAPFAIFVEAPQNTLNGFVLLMGFAVGTCLLLTARSQRSPQ